jgi:hypothetical protein
VTFRFYRSPRAFCIAANLRSSLRAHSKKRRERDSLLGPLAFIQEHLPELDPLGIVNVEDRNGAAAGLRAAEEDCAVPLEVAFP